MDNMRRRALDVGGSTGSITGDHAVPSLHPRVTPAGSKPEHTKFEVSPRPL